MRKLIFLLLFIWSFNGLSAQSIQKSKIRSISKQQIKVDEKELEQFDEQLDTFWKALEAGDATQISATRKMIQSTMLREIQQSELAMPTNKKVAAQHETSRGLKPHISNDNSQRATESISTQQQSIYDQFAAIESIEDEQGKMRMQKLLLNFSELLEQDLIEKKKLQADKE